MNLNFKKAMYGLSVLTIFLGACSVQESSKSETQGTGTLLLQYVGTGDCLKIQPSGLADTKDCKGTEVTEIWQTANGDLDLYVTKRNGEIGLTNDKRLAMGLQTQFKLEKHGGFTYVTISEIISDQDVGYTTKRYCLSVPRTNPGNPKPWHVTLQNNVWNNSIPSFDFKKLSKDLQNDFLFGGCQAFNVIYDHKTDHNFGRI